MSYLISDELRKEILAGLKKLRKAEQLGLLTESPDDEYIARGSLVVEPPAAGLPGQTATKAGAGDGTAWRTHHDTDEFQKLKMGDGSTDQTTNIRSLPPNLLEAHWDQHGQLYATATGTFVAKVSTVISAASVSSGTLTLGSGAVIPYGRDASGGFVATGTTAITVYNWSTAASGNPSTHHVWVQVLRNQVDGCLYYAGEACDSVEI